MIIKDFRVYHISKKLNPALPNAVYSLEYIEHVFLELEFRLPLQYSSPPV